MRVVGNIILKGSNTINQQLSVEEWPEGFTGKYWNEYE